MGSQPRGRQEAPGSRADVGSGSTAERVRDIVEPLLTIRSLELIDVELTGGQLRLTVDRDGGVDLDALSEATRVVSRALDDADPLPHRYTLEVSSPGLERTLRTPAHFARALGATVNVKTMPGTEGARRLAGILAAADDTGIVISTESDTGERSEHHVAYHDIERARTVFQWGPPPKPGRAKPSARPPKKAAK